MGTLLASSKFSDFPTLRLSTLGCPVSSFNWILVAIQQKGTVDFLILFDSLDSCVEIQDSLFAQDNVKLNKLKI